MSNVKVGDKFTFPPAHWRGTDATSLKAGTVVRDPEGGLRVRADDGMWVWTDKGTVPDGEYEVVYVPDAPFPPYEELAYELKKKFYGKGYIQGFPLGAQWYDVAKYVAENFTRNSKPSKIVDAKYRTWVLQGDGTYTRNNIYTDLPGYDQGYTREMILKEWGIDEEIA